MIVREKAYPRGGLIGNPSDGYFGKTIALAFTNFEADVVVYETPELEIMPNARDHSRFTSVKGLSEDVKLFGYYGGIRLLKATIKRLSDYCEDHGIDLPRRNFTIRYQSNIPRLVGLGGSSAIITAGMRALCEFFGLRIPRAELANLVLEVETRELGINAGLQDRVAQAYQGLVYMDFARPLMEQQGYGDYEELDPTLLPPLYIAYRSDLSQGSEIVHSDMRARFDRGDRDILEAIEEWANLTDKVRTCLIENRGMEIGPLLDANFDRRLTVCEVTEGNQRMVEAARSAGASAKFTGSGGAIIGTYENEKMFRAMRQALEPLDVIVIKPVIAPAYGETDA